MACSAPATAACIAWADLFFCLIDVCMSMSLSDNLFDLPDYQLLPVQVQNKKILNICHNTLPANFFLIPPGASYRNQGNLSSMNACFLYWGTPMECRCSWIAVVQPKTESRCILSTEIQCCRTVGINVYVDTDTTWSESELVRYKEIITNSNSDSNQTFCFLKRHTVQKPSFLWVGRRGTMDVNQVHAALSEQCR